MHMTPKTTIWGKYTRTEKTQFKFQNLLLKLFIGHSGHFYFSVSYRCHAAIWSVHLGMGRMHITRCQIQGLNTQKSTDFSMADEDNYK